MKGANRVAVSAKQVALLDFGEKLLGSATTRKFAWISKFDRAIAMRPLHYAKWISVTAIDTRAILQLVIEVSHGLIMPLFNVAKSDGLFHPAGCSVCLSTGLAPGLMPLTVAMKFIQ